MRQIKPEVEIDLQALMSDLVDVGSVALFVDRFSYADRAVEIVEQTLFGKKPTILIVGGYAPRRTILKLRKGLSLLSEGARRKIFRDLREKLDRDILESQTAFKRDSRHTAALSEFQKECELA